MNRRKFLAVSAGSAALVALAPGVAHTTTDRDITRPTGGRWVKQTQLTYENPGGALYACWWEGDAPCGLADQDGQLIKPVGVNVTYRWVDYPDGRTAPPSPFDPATWGGVR